MPSVGPATDALSRVKEAREQKVERNGEEDS